MVYSIEYIIFSLVIVVGLYGIHLALRNKVKGLSKEEEKKVFYYIPTIISLITIVFLVSGLFLNNYFERVERSRLSVLVEGFLPTLSKILEEAGHAKITLDTKETDPIYRLLLHKVNYWADQTGMIQSVYTIRKYPDGKNHLIIDTPHDYNHNGKIDGELEESAPIGEVYESYIPELERAFEGITLIEPYPTVDKWGSSIGGFSPIYKNRKVEAVLGVDFDGKIWEETINRAHILVMSYLLVPIFLLFVFYYNIITQRIFVVRNYRLAHYDQLTKVPNRLLFEKRINETLSESGQYSGSFAMLLMDVDKFKEINDRFGHLCGDTALQLTAERLINCVGNKEAVFRISGDEFVILLQNYGVMEAKKAVEKLEECFHTPIYLENNQYELSLSIGIAHYPTNGNSVKELIKFADTDMYKNKSMKKQKNLSK